MAKSTELVPLGEIVGILTLKELCRICGSEADLIVELVEEGILDPVAPRSGARPSRARWRFTASSITTVRKVQRLQADLDVNLPGVALVLTLVDQNARLMRRLRDLEGAGPQVIPMPGPDDWPDDWPED